MGKASRNKRRRDLIDVLRSGTCIHCLDRPRDGESVWCRHCVVVVKDNARFHRRMNRTAFPSAEEMLMLTRIEAWLLEHDEEEQVA